MENRARFALEVVKTAVDVWGPERVGIKLNPAGGNNDIGYMLRSYVLFIPLLMARTECRFKRPWTRSGTSSRNLTSSGSPTLRSCGMWRLSMLLDAGRSTI